MLDEDVLVKKERNAISVTYIDIHGLKYVNEIELKDHPNIDPKKIVRVEKQAFKAVKIENIIDLTLELRIYISVKKGLEDHVVIKDSVAFDVSKLVPKSALKAKKLPEVSFKIKKKEFKDFEGDYSCLNYDKLFGTNLYK